MSETSTFTKITRVAISSLLIAGVPVATVLTGFAKDHPVAALVLVGVWEILLLFVAIATRVYKNLSDLWVGRLTKLLDNKLARVSSRYNSIYKRHIRAANSHMEQLGLATRSEYALGLRDIYITLSLDPNSIHTLSANPLDYSTEALNATSSTIWEWMAESRKYENVLAIIGPPGSGKTTILKHVALIIADSPGRQLKKVGVRRGTLPVILTLRHLKTHFADDDAKPKLADLIRQGLADLAGNEPPSWVENNLQRSRFLIMLDGLDEVASPATRWRISKWIDRQQELYPETTFVVTSRPFGYQTTPLQAATVVQVRPFSEGEIKKFVTRWYRATAARRYGQMHDAAQLYSSNGAAALISNINWSADVLELAVNPLLLTMVCNVHEYRGALPGTRLELYKEICEVLLSRRNQDRGIESPVSGLKKQSILQKLALYMMREGIRDVGSQDLEPIIGEAVSRVTADYSALQLIKDVEESSGLIVEREANAYGFAHLSFQEYLASVEIAETQQAVLIYDNLANSWWRETILLYAAQSDATEIVERCLAYQNDASLLSLAVTCSDVSLEISPSARHALSRLREGDFRSDKDRRRTAGAVQLFSRLPSFTRVAEDTYVSRRPITWLEYQLFIDQAAPQYVPDDWRESVFPSGMQDHPAVGIRASDAVSFCMWVQGVYGDGWSYRPIGSAIARSLSDSSFLEPGGVEVTYAMQPRPADPESGEDPRPDGPARSRAVQGVLVEEGVQPTLLWEGVTLPLSAAGMPERIRSILTEEMKLDRALVVARREEDGSIDRSGLDDSGVLDAEFASYIVNDHADNRDLNRELRKLSTNAMWLDLASSLSWSEDASAAVRELLSMSSLQTVQDQIWKLSTLSEISTRGLAIAFNRITAPESKFANCHEERTTARLATLAAYRICDNLASTLQEAWAPSTSSLPSRSTRSVLFGWLKRQQAPATPPAAAHAPIEGIIADDGGASLSPGFLRSEFLHIYYNLLLLESRINGRSVPWEGLFIARTRQ